MRFIFMFLLIVIAIVLLAFCVVNRESTDVQFPFIGHAGHGPAVPGRAGRLRARHDQRLDRHRRRPVDDPPRLGARPAMNRSGRGPDLGPGPPAAEVGVERVEDRRRDVLPRIMGVERLPGDLDRPAVAEFRPGPVDGASGRRGRRRGPRGVELAEGAVVAGEHRRPVSQGVEDGEAEPLVERRVDRPAGRPVEPAEVAVGDDAEEPDPPAPASAGMPSGSAARSASRAARPTRAPSRPAVPRCRGTSRAGRRHSCAVRASRRRARRSAAARPAGRRGGARRRGSAPSGRRRSGRGRTGSASRRRPSSRARRPGRSPTTAGSWRRSPVNVRPGPLGVRLRDDQRGEVVEDAHLDREGPLDRPEAAEDAGARARRARPAGPAGSRPDPPAEPAEVLVEARVERPSGRSAPCRWRRTAAGPPATAPAAIRAVYRPIPVRWRSASGLASRKTG